jgi:hypothetical protein
MSLSEQERRELLEDARSLSRRKAFRAAGRAGGPASLEEWLRWIDEIQRVFKPWPASRRATRTARNKL